MKVYVLASAFSQGSSPTITTALYLTEAEGHAAFDKAADEAEQGDDPTTVTLEEFDTTTGVAVLLREGRDIWCTGEDPEFDECEACGDAGCLGCEGA